MKKPPRLRRLVILTALVTIVVLPQLSRNAFANDHLEHRGSPTPLPFANGQPWLFLPFVRRATSAATATPPSPTPSGGAPLCPSHDATTWHGLYDAARGCRYDHTHNADPGMANHVFGPVAYAGGQTISYPWATSAMENHHKHGGYKYAVRLDLPCGIVTEYETRQPIHCITDARVQYHIVGHAMDALTRLHSYYLEYRICRYPSYAQCGILRIGGWVHFGELQIPYTGARFLRPGGTVDFGLGSTYGGGGAQLVMAFDSDTSAVLSTSGEPYVAMTGIEDEAFLREHGVLDCCFTEVWSADDLDNEFGYNPYARFLVRVWDSWGVMNTSNLNQPRFFCRDGACDFNASRHSLNEISARIPAAWDSNSDGLANFQGYTNRHGHLASGCTAPGLDCVPLSVENVPVGYAHFADPGNGSDGIVEYDTSPPGQRWIRFPN
jgi:hypothetical protein